MKYLLLATLIAVCFAGSLTASENGKTINFKHDIHPESLVGFTFEGNIDPMNHLNNKITTFLKIVKTYIPILKTIGQKEQGLSFRRVYRVNFPGLDVIIDIYFQLLIGWRVENASSQTSFFNVTYVPFIQGWMNGLFNGTAAPGVGWYTVDLQFLNSYAPIGLQIYSNKVCFGGSWVLEPATLATKMHVALFFSSNNLIEQFWIYNRERLQFERNNLHIINLRF